MTFIKNYFSTIKAFIKDEDNMTKGDFLVYLFILLSLSYYRWKTSPKVCLMQTGLEKYLDLGKLVLSFVVVSTLTYSLYKMIKDSIKKKDI